MRFSNAPWKKTRIGNILKIKSGADQKKIECNDGIYNIYGSGGMIGKTNTALYSKESVGIGRKGTIDKPYYFDKPFWTVDTLFYSKIKNHYAKFIYYLFQTIKWKLYNQSTGVPSLTSSVIESINVYIPLSILEEKRIADFLTLIDERIQTQKKIINLLESQINQIRNQLILELENRKDFILLSEILMEYTNKTEKNNIYFVLSSTKSGIHLQSEYFNKEAASEDTTGYKIVPRGYCTYRSMSDTGEFTFNIQKIIDFGIVSPAYPVFTTKYNNKFVIEYLNFSSKLRNQILSLKEGGTRFALSIKKLKTLPIPNVSLDEQTKFINTLNKFKYKIENEKQILSLFELQKQYLLDKMFI